MKSFEEIYRNCTIRYSLYEKHGEFRAGARIIVVRENNNNLEESITTHQLFSSSEEAQKSIFAACKKSIDQAIDVNKIFIPIAPKNKDGSVKTASSECCVQS